MVTGKPLFVAAAVLATALSATAASAQYFGRNKVHYKTLDFQVLETEHFDIYYYPDEREGVDIAARLAERWYARLSRLLKHSLRGRQPLVLYASHTDFEQTNVIRGEIGESTGGVTESARRRIVLPFAGPLADTDHVLGHELVHAFQFDMTSTPDTPRGATGAHQLPLWFVEGMAEYLSIGPVDPHTAMWLRDGARQDKLPTIDDLTNGPYFPYRWGHAFWAYVGGRWGDAVIGDMLVAGAQASGDVDEAIMEVLKIAPADLSRDWQAAIRAAYGPVLTATTAADETGRVAIGGGAFGSTMNVGPAISPDGRRVAFLSERNIFSTDLFVAEVATGRIVRTLTETATNPHYSSLQFIYSAGAWAADSRRIAIATIASGRPALAIFDVETGDKEREVAVPDLDEILNPTWAPDGHAIAFTGMSRGLTDLYVYDLAASRLIRLTNDPFAELQPAWSPDGRRIAFATDRFSTRLADLAVGEYRLALIDPNGGPTGSLIEPVPSFPGAKHINPQWSPDSAALYFVSDRDGIPNLYRRTLASGAVVQLTRLGTGVSGITAISPALSVASGTGTAAFNVYDRGRYDIYTLDVSSRDGALTPAGGAAAQLPPGDRRPSDVAMLLADPAFGLPAPAAPRTESDYRSGLSLEGIGQPSLSVGASSFGPSIGGGVSFLFSDLLGNHSLLTAVQFNSGFGQSSFKDLSFQAAYINQARRWNWGLVGGQSSYVSGGFQTATGTFQGQPVQFEQTVVFRQTERSLAGLIAYPFNRSERVEFMTGISHATFDQNVETAAFSLITGQLVAEGSDEASIGDPLTFGTSSAALVHDTANFGATSPVQGQRYRFGVAPTYGAFNYTSLLLDYRRYLMPVPFYTIAGRLLHYGRYGSGSEDPRLTPLSLGYPTLVRGYNASNFDSSACVLEANNPSQCPAFDRLIGSRMLVGNLEFRFPILRPFGASPRMYGPLPVEVALFADAGLAWNSLQQPVAVAGTTLAPTQRHPLLLKDMVSSAGVALRVNLSGFAIGEFDFVRPFRLPNSGWVFQFNLTPGF